MRSTATWRRAYGRCGTGTRISSPAMSAEPGDAVAGPFGLELSQSQREQLAVLARLLRDRDAPTSARAAEGAASVHVADSLAALALDVLRHAGTIADVGAGAGFPGLALAVALPRSEVRLVESRGLAWRASVRSASSSSAWGPGTDVQDGAVRLPAPRRVRGPSDRERR